MMNYEKKNFYKKNSIWASVSADVDVDDLIFNYEKLHATREDYDLRSDR